MHCESQYSSATLLTVITSDQVGRGEMILLGNLITQQGRGSKSVPWCQNILLSFNNLREYFCFNTFAQIQTHFSRTSSILENKDAI